MKFLRYYFFFGLLGIGSLSYGQNSMGVGTQSPNPNAVMELVSPSNDQGFLVPRLTTAQRTADSFITKLSENDKGLMVFDSDENKFYFWDGNGWTTISTDSAEIIAGTGIQIDGQGVISNTGDLDQTNELLDRNNTTLSGTTLSLVDAGGSIDIDLSPLQDGTGTDNQDLQLDGNLLTLTNDGTSVDLAPYLDNTDQQDLSLSGNVLNLSNDPTTVDLSGYLDNTDSQSLDFVGTQLSITGGNTIDLSSLQDADGDPMNEIQDLQLTGNQLSITNNASATTIDLAPFAGTNTDEQQLNFDGTNLSITGGNIIDISSLGDDADANPGNELITGAVLNSTVLEITDAGGTTSVDLVSLQDGTGTDNQDLELSGNTLSLTNDGTTVDLSGYLDNTDQQTLSVGGGSLSISGGNSVELALLQDGIGTDNQDLELSGNTLTLTNDGTPVDLSGYLDNTDEQQVNFDGTNLSITGGNTIDISSLGDDADANPGNELITGAVLNSTVLEITDAGGITSVDLVSLQDGTGTDNQDLELSGNTLSLTNDGTTVDLSGYLDNTDQQTLSVGGGSLSISGGNSVELALLQDGFEANTDEQDLEFSGGQITLTGDPNSTVIDLSAYDDNASDDLVLGTPQTQSSVDPLINVINQEGETANFTRTSGTSGVALRATSTQNGGVAEFVKSGDNNLPILTLDDQSSGVGPAIQANRGIIIGDLSNGIAAGALRWNGTDFQGYDGSAWLSLSASSFSGDWGDLTNVPAGFNDGIDNTADGDSNDTNEYIESASMSGDILRIFEGPGGNNNINVDLSQFALPGQSGNGGEFLTTNGTSAGWSPLPWTTSGSNVYRNSGRVGIGTTSPNHELHIASSTTFSALQLTSSGTGTTATDGLKFIMNASGDAAIYNYESRQLRFGTSGSTRMTIESNGDVGVGTNNPSAKLDVVGDVELNGNLISDAKNLSISGTGNQLSLPDRRVLKLQNIGGSSARVNRIAAGVDGQELIIMVIEPLRSNLGENNSPANEVIIERTTINGAIGNKIPEMIVLSANEHVLTGGSTLHLMYDGSNEAWVEIGVSINQATVNPF